MPRIHRFRNLVFGIATVFAVTLLAPLAVTAEDEVADLAPVAAPAAVGTSVEDAVATRVLAAEQALERGDIGSMQEEALFAIVAAAPSWDESSGYGSVEASRAANAMPAAPDTSTSAEQTRVIAAQQALQSQDLGSLQEEALLIVVAAGQSWDQTSGYGSVEASRAIIGHPATSTTDEAALLAQFRAIELSLSRYLGAD
jgi:hypothetical protein